MFVVHVFYMCIFIYDTRYFFRSIMSMFETSRIKPPLVQHIADLLPAREISRRAIRSNKGGIKLRAFFNIFQCIQVIKIDGYLYWLFQCNIQGQSKYPCLLDGIWMYLRVFRLIVHSSGFVKLSHNSEGTWCDSRSAGKDEPTKTGNWIIEEINNPTAIYSGSLYSTMGIPKT